jgi:hypothetical protein
MYEVGRVHIWQNQVGDWAYLNGTETTVTGPPKWYWNLDGKKVLVQSTDTESPIRGHMIGAFPGDLRPRDTPSGERQVFDMFKRTRDEEFFARNGRYPCVMVPVEHA